MKIIAIKERPIKTSKLLNECRKKFKVWSYYSDEQLDKDFPIPKMTTRYFKDTVEADEKLKNLSANDLEAKGILGITLRERLIMELEYFDKTGKHLDIQNITLCSGSRDSVGHVPYAGWHGARLYVYWVLPSYDYVRLRPREVVSS